MIVVYQLRMIPDTSIVFVNNRRATKKRFKGLENRTLHLRIELRKWISFSFN